MGRISCLAHQGKVKKFEQFINEKMDVGIETDELSLKQDEQCFNACWSIIEQQSGGDYETMIKYLQTEMGIPYPSNKDLVIYVMELVDDYFNNNITITQGEQFIKHGKKADFIEAISNIDYKMVVHNLLSELLKVDDKDDIPPYVVELFKILDDCLIKADNE